MVKQNNKENKGLSQHDNDVFCMLPHRALRKTAVCFWNALKVAFQVLGSPDTVHCIRDMISPDRIMQDKQLLWQHDTKHCSESDSAKPSAEHSGERFILTRSERLHVTFKDGGQSMK